MATVDAVTGQRGYLDIQTGVSQVLTSRIPEIDELLAKIDRQSAEWARFPGDRPVVVRSIAADSRANLYLLLSPYAISGPVTVLKLRRDFDTPQRFDCVAPPGGFRQINRLAVHDRQLFLATVDGRVLAYTLP